ncbi:MAG: cbb3-type cytochrome c oxidase subunit I [Clostridia bacterium]|nr:cbb3-type cytochrome c oxidase subunit I [Clostridia bacterium]
MENKETQKKASKVTRRKDILAVIYFCGGIASCFYSFKKIAWMCLEGFGIMFNPNGQFSTIHCIGAIMLFFILVGIFVGSGYYLIGDSEEYARKRYNLYCEKKQLQEQEKRD